jgi:hypothetical protein
MVVRGLLQGGPGAPPERDATHTNALVFVALQVSTFSQHDEYAFQKSRFDALKTAIARVQRRQSASGTTGLPNRQDCRGKRF